MTGPWILEPPSFDIALGHRTEGAGAGVRPACRPTGVVRPVDVAGPHHLAAARRRYSVDGAEQAAGGIGGKRQILLGREGGECVVPGIRGRHGDASHDLLRRGAPEVEDERHGDLARSTGHISEGTQSEGSGQGQRCGSCRHDEGTAAESAPDRDCPPPAVDVLARRSAISGNRSAAAGGGHGTYSLPGHAPEPPGSGTLLDDRVRAVDLDGRDSSNTRAASRLAAPPPEECGVPPTVADQRRNLTGFPARGFMFRLQP